MQDPAGRCFVVVPLSFDALFVARTRSPVPELRAPGPVCREGGGGGLGEAPSQKGLCPVSGQGPAPSSKGTSLILLP